MPATPPEPSRETSLASQTSEAILESLAYGLVLLDAQGRVQWLNRAMFGLVGQGVPFSLPCDLQSADCPALLRALLAQGGHVLGPYEVITTLPSGAGAAYRVTPTALECPAGGCLCMVQDVTAERQTHCEAYTFIAQEAHELRTPLQHILTFAGLLYEIPELSEEQRRDLLRNIQDESITLSLLLDDLLQWGRLGQGRFSVHKRRTRLDALVTALVDKFRLRAQAAQLTLEVRAETEVWVYTDPVRLEQVLANVLNNALTYQERGGSVRVDLQQAAGQATISVADSGPGIAPEALERLFEPFFQGADSLAAHSGAGLGLSISRQIMGVLGGSIRAESCVGQGSTFYLQLPALVE